ncbi:hypothetical protein CXU01_10220 [Akkermansia muciniphila]|uniref:hypothetical protein n=1 Tax=Akkermansia muciniphila TaxID=239935 RepID=UPI000C9AEC12|nr:hypothetical protein [Akkermansia muciniphila]PNC79105.1 hypothetical protein CXU01_10220 [Akkermansia muciniphila]
MSKIYSISYDLNAPGQKYNDLYDAIESYESHKILRSHYLIYTSSTASQIYNKLKPCLDKNDSIFISEVNSNQSGWLDKAACDWIAKWL